MNRTIQTIFLISLLFILFIFDLSMGSVAVSLSDILSVFSETTSLEKDILLTFRIPKAVTAMLAGGGLAVSGLLMQTFFRNPLAGPYVLGISSGASLGVALIIMASGALSSFFTLNIGSLGIAGAATAGAMGSLFLIFLVSQRISDSSTILIIGLMIGHVVSALVGLIQYFSTAQSLQGFIMWSLGSFNNVVWEQLFVLSILVITGVVLSYFLSKPLNILLLGENYARSLGLNIRRSRVLIITVTGILSGSITAFCGPIAFIGLAIPHLVKAIYQTTEHRTLIPLVCFMGASVALLCDIIAQIPGGGQILPINVITSLMGAPVIIWIIIRQRRFS